MAESTGPTTDRQDPREATLRDLAWRDLIPPVLAVTPVAWGLAAAQMLLRLLTHGNYGVFRDEFYYLACADHLAWGYVDHPPLSIALLWLQRGLFGDSVIALRLLPTLAAGFLVLMTAVLARELGGGRFAQGLAALTAASVPQYLGMTGVYSMNSIDLVMWVLVLWLVARGINLGLNTRMYFGDEDKANSADPVLGRIDSAARRQTLIAERNDTGSPPVYRFDIHLQGASETVFLDI